MTQENDWEQMHPHRSFLCAFMREMLHKPLESTLDTARYWTRQSGNKYEDEMFNIVSLRLLPSLAVPAEGYAWMQVVKSRDKMKDVCAKQPRVKSFSQRTTIATFVFIINLSMYLI